MMVVKLKDGRMLRFRQLQWGGKVDIYLLSQDYYGNHIRTTEKVVHVKPDELARWAWSQLGVSEEMPEAES